MSFQNKGFWMAKGTGRLNDGELAYDNSAGIEPKRPHQWLLDGTQADLFPNKKQAVEVPCGNSFSELLNSNVSSWGNASSFHSATGQFTERLFDPETARSINFDDRNIQSVSTGDISVGRKVIGDPLGTNSSFGLSIAHTFEDPRSGLNYGGIRKVKVSQVKESENFMSASLGQAYNIEDNSTMSAPQTYAEADDNSISMGLSFSRGNDNGISLNGPYNRVDNNFISMGQPFHKADNSTILMGQPYKENTNAISMGQYFGKGNDSIATMGQTFNEEDDNYISMCNTFEDNNKTITVGQSLGKCHDSLPSMGVAFNKRGKNISMGNSNKKVDDNTISMGHTYNKVENNTLPIDNSFGKGESNIISFGGFQDDDNTNSSERLMCSYDLLLGQTSTEGPEALSEKGLVESNSDPIVSASKLTSSASETVSKKKEDQKGSKKVSTNNFPSNVRSLLSTGMLDGVPVKYIAWSREKELRGIIKGSGYLCGCQSCNLSKAINAYEFERHAGCKTKHPNNHIFFESGKTVYGIVQELKNTPQNLLFEVIQTITGSPINQKSFRIWKESFLAATRELQRIYGKDEGKQLS